MAASSNAAKICSSVRHSACAYWPKLASAPILGTEYQTVNGT
jgi:hypothetical protein